MATVPPTPAARRKRKPTAIRPCARHPAVFLHHRCMAMACHSMTTHSKRTFEDLPLGSFCYACLQNCKK